MSIWITAAIGIPLLLLGGTTRPTLLASVLIAGGLAIVIRWKAHSSRERSVSARAASVALWLAAAASFVQFIPLPQRALRVLSPNASAIWTAADSEFGRALAWHPLSLDPPATEFLLATALLVATVFDALSRAASGTQGRRTVCIGIAAAVVVFDAASLLHAVFGLERLYGIYQPMHVGVLESHILSPLLNPNHAAAVACVAPPLLLGLFAEASSTGEKVLAATAAALSGAIAILTLSRGGMVVLAFETIAMLGIVALRRGSDRSDRAYGLAAGLVVAGISVAGALYIALPHILREASSHDVSKLRVPAAAWALVHDFPITGVGRGAFGSVFPGYQGGVGLLTGHVRFTHVESWPIQLVVDFGVPVACLLVGILAYALVRAAPRLLEKPSTSGAAIALIGLVLHDLVDFACDFAGVALVLAGLMAVVTSGGSQRVEAQARSDRPRRWIPGAVASIALAVGALAISWNRGLDDETAMLSQLWAVRGLDGLDDSVSGAALRHPAEPYFPMVRGVQLLWSPEAGRHFARAEALGPAWAMNHFWFARWFARMGRRGQAWSEFREATRLDSAVTGAVTAELIALGAPMDDVISIANTPDALERAAVELQRTGRGADVELLDRRSLQKFPNALGPRLRDIDRATAEGNRDLALRRAMLLRADVPSSALAVLALSRLQPDPIVAEKTLQDGLVAAPGDADLLRELIVRKGKRLGVEEVRSELDALAQSLSRSGRGAELPHLLEAEVEEARGRPGSAVAKYLDAAAVAFDPTPCLERAAVLAESTGELGVAESTWRRLAELSPSNTRYAEALSRVKRAALGRTILPARIPSGD